MAKGIVTAGDEAFVEPLPGRRVARAIADEYVAHFITTLIIANVIS